MTTFLEKSAHEAAGPSVREARVVIVGCGGNIGSHLVPLVGRTAQVSEVVLIDPDHYRAENIAGQNIRTSDVGAAKVEVQAAHLQRIRPGLGVSTWTERIETVPLMALAADVILACVDTRRARQEVGQVATRLGVPWIDAGVDAHFGMVRVSTFLPGRGPCIECGWGSRDYERLEQIHACRAATESLPTGAEASLGSLAASFQALELQKWLRGAVGPPREVTVSVSDLKMRTTTSPRNPECRVPDHRAWEIECPGKAPEELTVGDLRGLARAGGATDDDRSFLEVEGSAFVHGLRCPSCGGEEPVLLLDRYLLRQAHPCSACGTEATFGGGEMTEQIDLSALAPEVRGRSMERLGFRPGDVFTVYTAATKRRYAFGANGGIIE